MQKTGRIAVSQSPGPHYQQYCVYNNFFSQVLQEELAFLVQRIIASEPITSQCR